jgi:hypothetical protein
MLPFITDILPATTEGPAVTRIKIQSNLPVEERRDEAQTARGQRVADGCHLERQQMLAQFEPVSLPPRPDCDEETAGPGIIGCREKVRPAASWPDFLSAFLSGSFWKHKSAASFWKHKFAIAANLCFQSQTM